MAKYTTLLFRYRLAATLVFACLTLAGIGVWVSARLWPSYAKPQEIELRAINRTKALQVASVKKVGEGISSDVELTLLNQSSRNIAAYMISMGEVSITTFSGSFAPGETRVEKIPFSSLESNAAKTPGQAGELVLSAVYLEGGYSEGEAQHLNYLTNRMTGMKEHAKLVLPILRQALNSPQSGLENALDAVEAETTLLPIEDQYSKSSPQRKGGRAWIQGKLRREIQDLKNKNKHIAGYNLRAGLEELIASYEQLIATL